MQYQYLQELRQKWLEPKPWLTCEHSQSEVRFKIGARGKYFREQCLVCGANIRVVKLNEVSLPDSILAFDDNIRTTFLNRQQFLQQRLTDELGREYQSNYDGYLHSSEWRSKRQKVFERFNGLCEGCREAPATEVHHLTYVRIGNEMLFDLVAVCESCHKKLHGQ